MDRRLESLVFAVLVVLATMAWTPSASAAIVVNPAALPQLRELGSGEMSNPNSQPAPCVPWFHRDQGTMPLLGFLTGQSGAGVPPSTSSVTSASAGAVAASPVALPPPRLTAYVLAGPGLFFPGPPVFLILDVPRLTRITAPPGLVV